MTKFLEKNCDPFVLLDKDIQSISPEVASHILSLQSDILFGV